MPSKDPEVWKKWRENNKDKLKEAGKKYRDKNKDILKLRSKLRRDKLKEETGYSGNKAYQDAYRDEHREELRAKSRQYRRDFTMRIWSAAKKRAKDKDVPFDITPEDILIPEVCPVLGLKGYWSI